MNDIDRIYDVLKNKELSFHNKVLNIWVNGGGTKDTFPELPPLICSCEITLLNGDKFKAYRDNKCKDWIEYGNTWRIRREGRRMWKNEEVRSWIFI